MWWPQCRGTPDTERYMRSICIYEQSESLKKRKQLIIDKRTVEQHVYAANISFAVTFSGLWSGCRCQVSAKCLMFFYIFLLKFFLFLFSHALDCSRASHQWELGKLDREEGERPNHTAPALSFIS